MLMKIKSKSGFTLIEVLIVVSIIGLLSSVVLVGLRGFRSQGRDVRRIADLKSIQNGLELYYNTKGNYPADLNTLTTAGIGITKLPADPVAGQSYEYGLCDSGQGYVIGATLDANAGDAIFNDSAVTCNQTAVPCTGKQYCVSF